MSYVKNWLHCVWGTKNRKHFLLEEKKYEIINHIRTNAVSKGIYIDYINGYLDHIHCLISLNPDQSLAKVIQLIKGESSFWINKNMILKNRFEWADEYFGISVSPSGLSKVREYIKNQEIHHKLKTWAEEYEVFIQECDFAENDG
jgi:putative transposase